jgi:hypothetical protein
VNAIGFLALLYVVVSTFMWGGREMYERGHTRVNPRWLRWSLVYVWPLVAVFHWYNVAMLRYYRLMDMIDELDGKP